MKKLFCITLVLLAITMLGVSQTVLGSDIPQRQPSPTPSPTTDHASHHPDGTPTPNMNGQSSGGMMDMMDMMGQIQGMMDMMMGMEMSDEMQGMMGQMQGMMDMMGMEMSDEMHGMMMGQMQGMMGMMMGMEMSDEMRGMMGQMQGMMDMMMGDHSQHQQGQGSDTVDHSQHQQGQGSDTVDHSQHQQGQGSDTVDHSQHQQGQGSDTVDHSQHQQGTANQDHSAHSQPISAEGVEPATETVGAQALDFTLVDGVKVFEITAKPVLWTLLDGVQVVAWTYNGTVPGPMIRVTEGDQVRIVVNNQLPEPTTVHWHGVQVPFAMDGVPGVSQDPILPGETFTYEFTAQPAGTFMYHTHYNSDVQMGLGLFAPFIIDPAETSDPAPDVDVSIMLSEWRVINGETFPAMPMAAMEPNYFTFNGRAFPNQEAIEVKQGERVRLRLYGAGQFSHPIHLHGMSFKVVAIDGMPVPAALQQSMDTISVAPGQRFDIEFIANAPGQWMLHCHILHHTMNADGTEGGMMLVINVTE